MGDLSRFSIQSQLQLRFLNSNDIDEVKALCKECFPIEYPDSWYEQITGNAKFYALAATYAGKIVAMLISELKPKNKCNKEDTSILSDQFPANTPCAYILSIAVSVSFRRHGIASHLLDSFVSYLTTSDERNKCKVIYLHVLTSNQAAIKFYESRNFKQQNYLPCYYSIGGSLWDGFTYALFINGGKPPFTTLDYLKSMSHWLSSSPVCTLPQRLLSSAHNLWKFLTGTSPQAAVSMTSQYTR